MLLLPPCSRRGTTETEARTPESANFRGDLPRHFRVVVEEFRTWANFEIVQALHERELKGWTHYGRLGHQSEKQLEGLDDCADRGEADEEPAAQEGAAEASGNNAEHRDRVAERRIRPYRRERRRTLSRPNSPHHSFELKTRTRHQLWGVGTLLGGTGDLDGSFDVGTVFNLDAGTPDISGQLAATTEFDALTGLDFPFHGADDQHALPFYFSLDIGLGSDRQCVCGNQDAATDLTVHPQILPGMDFALDANRATQRGWRNLFRHNG